MCRTSKDASDRINMSAATQNSWSDWLDFNKENIEKSPSSPGVFMMHAAMKILFIDSSDNIKVGVTHASMNPCIANATRFRFMVTESHDSIKEDLIKDYQERHNGSLPRCMQ